MKPEYLDRTFASNEELELFYWAEQAKEHGLIREFTHQSPTWQLAEPVIETIEQRGKRGQVIKPKTRVILKGATYTADFHFQGIQPGVPISEYVDVKPAFTRRNDTDRYFRLIRKWLYQRHGAIVHPLVPIELFGKTFAPARARVTPKQGKPRKHYCDMATVEEFARGIR